MNPIDLRLVVDWPQAVVAVVALLALLVWPAVASLLNTRATQRTVASAKRTLVETHERVAEVRDHVANTHSTNLRDDLDGMAGDIREIKTIVIDLVPRVTALEAQSGRRRRLLG